MDYSLFKIVGGEYDGRVLVENNNTNYKIILATPSLKAKVGIKILSTDEEGNSIPISFIPTTAKEQRKLFPHLINQLKVGLFFQDLQENIQKKASLVIYGNAGIGKSSYNTYVSV